MGSGSTVRVTTIGMRLDEVDDRRPARASTRPPGSRLPAIVQTLLYAARPTEFIEWNWRRFGDTFTLKNVAFGEEVIVSRPEAVKEVFTGDPEAFRAGEANSLMRPIIGGSSMLLLDGKAHLRKRRLILPPFHGERMSEYGRIMVEETERAISCWRRGQTVALRQAARQITLSVILRAVFGADDAGEHRALADAISDWMRVGSSTSGGLSVFIPALQRDLGPRSPWGAFVRARARVDELLYALIARRRRESIAGRSDVLSLLLSAKDDEGQAMTDAELRDELITLLIAGHETTALTLCWLFEELLSRPEVRTEVAREAATTDVTKLRILDSAIKEAMRLRPVIPGVARLLKEPARIAGYDLPAGTLVVPAIHLTHRLPDLYPDPLSFRLDRFVDKKIDPYAWIPFGGGVRRCIGMAFALQELKLVAGTMLARHRLRLAKRPAGPTLRGLTIAPKGDTLLVVE